MVRPYMPLPSVWSVISFAYGTQHHLSSTPAAIQ